MTARIDRQAVLAELAALGPERAIGLLGVKPRRSGGKLRTATCAARGGDHSRQDAVVIEPSGLWHCKVCGEGDSLFAYLARMLGSDPARADAVEAVAHLVGVEPTEDPEATERRRRILAERAADAERWRLAEEERHARAEAAAAQLWLRLPRQSLSGSAYLRGRRLDGAVGDVRYGRHHICLALRAPDGSVRNVAGRRIDGAEPKVKCLSGCRKVGYVVGDLRKLTTTSGPIVLVEGLADFLAARLYWPERLILGADGGDLLPRVAAIAAPLAAGRGLLFVPHRDAAGERFIDRAVVRALEAGVASEDVEFFDVGEPHKDLADFWKAAA